jgi:kynurenine formamidase
MIINLELKSGRYSIYPSEQIDISIPMIFNGEQPNSYDVDKAIAVTYEAKGFLGDTRRGGSCNFEKYTLVPHCNGTHTECVGHISFEQISVIETMKECFLPARLLSVEPERALSCPDVYIPEKEANDLIITKRLIEESLTDVHENFYKALIIRTLPNDVTKKRRRYMQNIPPFFSIEAIEFIASLGTEHLLVDIPSIDRTFDKGKLTAHHIFWEVEKESHNVDRHVHSMKTITEMIYVPNEVTDGNYLLNIQIAPFCSDASPSRPMIYKLKEL